MASERVKQVTDSLGRMMTGFRWLAVLTAVAMSCYGAPALAQGVDAPDPLGLDFSFDAPNKAKSKSTATVSAELVQDAAKPTEAVLSITISMTGHSKTYGFDETSSYKPTIKVTGLTALGDGYVPDRAPKVALDEATGKNVGSYSEKVTFSRRFKLDGRDSATITGSIDFLFCDELTCAPKLETFSASVTRVSEVKAAAGASASAIEVTPPPAVAEVAPPTAAAPANPLQFGYRVTPKFRELKESESLPVEAQFELSPTAPKEGEIVTLAIHFDLKGEWHTYTIKASPTLLGEPTAIELEETPGLEPVGEWSESPKPTIKPVGDKEQRAFYNEVTWRRTFRRTGQQPIAVSGKVIFPICEGEKRCLSPKHLAFALGGEQPAKVLAAAVPVTQSHLIDSAPVATSETFEIAAEAHSTTLLGVLLFAFLGGLTLNIMPCVLPVLAIKILSIVQQAGESRQRILLMNVVYTFGVISVFAILASLAAFAGVGWGQQFQQEWFRVATVLVVFVCGLNLLGVFEILLPGMLSQAAGGGEHREGLLGAFMTGVFATLLATPCSTGFMAFALAWSLKQTVPVIYLVWCTMGLGMALPYLLIGVYPGLIKWLPRPGMWMVRFKQLSAFAMFGACIWFLKPIDQRSVPAVLTCMIGLAVGLWMIGSLYDRESPLSLKTKVRVSAFALTAMICGFAYWMHLGATTRSPNELPWVAFDEKQLIELRKSGKPVLIDFTADWCAICKQNEHFALNRQGTADFIRRHGVITMVADFTNKDEYILKWLRKFEQESVPLTIIIPPDPKAKLIPLSGGYSEAELLKKLGDAMGGKSEATGAVVSRGATGPMAMNEDTSPDR